MRNSLCLELLVSAAVLLLSGCEVGPRSRRTYFFEKEKRAIIIPVAFNDTITGRFLFDTGATNGYLILDSSFCATHPLPAWSDKPDHVYFHLIRDGQLRKAPHSGRRFIRSRRERLFRMSIWFIIIFISGIKNTVQPKIYRERSAFPITIRPMSGSLISSIIIWRYTKPKSSGDPPTVTGSLLSTSEEA